MYVYHFLTWSIDSSEQLFQILWSDIPLTPSQCSCSWAPSMPYMWLLHFLLWIYQIRYAWGSLQPYCGAVRFWWVWKLWKSEKHGSLMLHFSNLHNFLPLMLWLLQYFIRLRQFLNLKQCKSQRTDKVSWTKTYCSQTQTWTWKLSLTTSPLN